MYGKVIFVGSEIAVCREEGEVVENNLLPFSSFRVHLRRAICLRPSTSREVID
jgi:hypothetical protein